MRPDALKLALRKDIERILAGPQRGTEPNDTAPDIFKELLPLKMAPRGRECRHRISSRNRKLIGLRGPHTGSFHLCYQGSGQRLFPMPRLARAYPYVWARWISDTSCGECENPRAIFIYLLGPVVSIPPAAKKSSDQLCERSPASKELCQAPQLQTLP